ncbi:hypothetical protein [Lysobacter sp. A289]
MTLGIWTVVSGSQAVSSTNDKVAAMSTAMERRGVVIAGAWVAGMGGMGIGDMDICDMSITP